MLRTIQERGDVPMKRWCSAPVIKSLYIVQYTEERNFENGERTTVIYMLYRESRELRRRDTVVESEEKEIE